MKVNFQHNNLTREAERNNFKHNGNVPNFRSIRKRCMERYVHACMVLGVCALPPSWLSSQSPPALFTSLSKDMQREKTTQKNSSGYFNAFAELIQAGDTSLTEAETETGHGSSADCSDIEKDRQQIFRLTWQLGAGIEMQSAPADVNEDSISLDYV